VKVVLDANCAIEIALNKKEGEKLKAVLDQSDQVLAPDLLVPEFVNTLWKYHQFDQLSLELCEEALIRLPDLVETFVPSILIYRDAFALSRAQKTRAACDMFYLALALRENATLLTLDGALKKEARRAGVRIG
jgi:predicted nucleic acid-binding protein